MPLGSLNRMVRKGYRLGSQQLKTFETPLEGLCCFMDTVSGGLWCFRIPPGRLRKDQLMVPVTGLDNTLPLDAS
jgi:hypothetical protein